MSPSGIFQQKYSMHYLFPICNMQHAIFLLHLITQIILGDSINSTIPHYVTSSILHCCLHYKNTDNQPSVG